MQLNLSANTFLSSEQTCELTNSVEIENHQLGTSQLTSKKFYLNFIRKDDSSVTWEL